MSLITDILIVASGAAFSVGIVSLFLKRIRINHKSRLYFLLSVCLFALALTMGWSDFVAGLNDCSIE